MLFGEVKGGRNGNAKNSAQKESPDQDGDTSVSHRESGNSHTTRGPRGQCSPVAPDLAEHHNNQRFTEIQIRRTLHKITKPHLLN